MFAMSQRGAPSNNSSPYSRPSKPYSRQPTGQPKSTRQQFTACGACRMRRVRCDLKDLPLTAANLQPACSNCQQRGLKCVDEFADVKAVKLRRRGRRLQQIDATYGKVADPESASSSPATTQLPSDIPQLSPEFFSSPFWSWLVVQHPVLDPVEFYGRFNAHSKGIQSLGHEGGLLAMLLVVWAASFGLDERGIPIPDVEDIALSSSSSSFEFGTPTATTSASRSKSPSSSASFRPDGEGLIPRKRRQERKERTEVMLKEVLYLIDFHGVMRRPTWDGVRVLLLIMPLLEEAHPLERFIMFSTALSQVQSLCTLSGFPTSPSASVGPLSGTLNDSIRARIFWYAHIHEGLSAGIRGGRLVLDNDCFDAFQRTLPPYGFGTDMSGIGGHSPTTRPLSKSVHEFPSQLPNTQLNSVTRSQSFFSTPQIFSIPLHLSATCRKIHAVLTGPKATREAEVHGMVDARAMEEIWEDLDLCWKEFDTVRGNGSSERESLDRHQFASAWQIYIFECHNVIKESLQRFSDKSSRAKSSPPHSSPSLSHLSSHHLHTVAVRKCLSILPLVLRIIEFHLTQEELGGDRSSLFKWDTGLVRDGCFYAGLLAANVEEDTIDLITDDVDKGLPHCRSRLTTGEGVALCLTALSEIKWAFSRSEEREQTIRMVWESRKSDQGQYSFSGSNLDRVGQSGHADQLLMDANSMPLEPLPPLIHKSDTHVSATINQSSFRTPFKASSRLGDLPGSLDTPYHARDMPLGTKEPSGREHPLSILSAWHPRYDAHPSAQAPVEPSIKLEDTLGMTGVYNHHHGIPFGAPGAIGPSIKLKDMDDPSSHYNSSFSGYAPIGPGIKFEDSRGMASAAYHHHDQPFRPHPVHSAASPTCMNSAALAASGSSMTRLSMDQVSNAMHSSHSALTPSSPQLSALITTPSHLDGNSTHRRSAHYITAEQAHAHVTTRESEIQCVLAQFGYVGPYSLHAGFNEEMIHLGQRQEEIYIVLDSSISSIVCDALEAVISPFPGIVYTPGGMHFIPTDTPNLRSMMQGSGEGLGRTTSNGTMSSCGNTSLGRGGGDVKGQGQAGNAGGGHGGGNDEGDDDDDDNGAGKGSGGPGGGGGGGGAGGGGGDGGRRNNDDHGPRLINIPFTSTLSSRASEDSRHLPIKFTTASCIDITVNENRKADSPPNGSRWSGPWFAVDMTMLDISTHSTSADLSKYTLGLSQIRIMASSCPTSVIKCSPGTTHAEEDIVKAKAERNTAGGAWATFSANPNLRLGGSMSRTTGAERTQRRWEIITHRLGAGDGPGGAGAHSKGMLWKYAHNKNGDAFERVAAESFENKPSAVFGFSRAPHYPMPLLEVEVVVYWSLSGSTQRSAGHSWHRDYLQPFRRSKGKGGVGGGGGGLPAFMNFLHHVSVVVDLGKVARGSSWIVDVDATDEQTVKGLEAAGGSIVFQPLSRVAEKVVAGAPSAVTGSECEIVLRRAVERRVAALTEGECAGAVPLLPVPGFGIASMSTMLSGLPTPLPSPRREVTPLLGVSGEPP